MGPVRAETDPGNASRPAGWEESAFFARWRMLPNNSLPLRPCLNSAMKVLLQAIASGHQCPESGRGILFAFSQNVGPLLVI